MHAGLHTPARILNQTALDHARIGSETSCTTGGNHRRHQSSGAIVTTIPLISALIGT